MKRNIAIVVLVVSLCWAMVLPSFAESANNDTFCYTITDSTEAIETEDGGYLTVTLVTFSTPGNEKASTYTKTAHKYATQYDVDGNVVWRYTLTGMFSVNSGVSATCSNASYSVENNSSQWHFSDCSASASGNVAHGVGTATKKVMLIIVAETVNIDLNLTCDKYGNIT